VFRERCPDSAQRPTFSEFGEDFVPAHKDLVAKLSPLSGGASEIVGLLHMSCQGTVIQKVGEHEIRDTGKGLNVAPDVGNDVLVELLKRAAERYEGGLTTLWFG